MYTTNYFLLNLCTCIMHMGFVELAFGRSACCCMIKWQGQECVDEMHSRKLILNPLSKFLTGFSSVCTYRMFLHAR
jgi:hypothetical protein